ncbi:unnamed protein product, partial [Gordionus sp. m RMFG-2023]
MESISEIPTQDTIQQNQTMERFILPKSKEGICFNRNTGNKQFASTSNHLEDTENQEQIPTQDTIQQNQTMERFILPKSKEGIIASTRIPTQDTIQQTQTMERFILPKSKEGIIASTRIPTQDTIQQNQTMERFILPKSKEGIIASTREKARKRHALCCIKKSNEQSLIPTTSNHLEDTGNKQFASTSNHLEDTEYQEQEKARKRQALCRIKKRNEQSLIPTTSNHLEDTGNKQFASTSNHLVDTENQEQEKARKRQALCRIKKRNEQSLIPTTSNHLEDTGNEQFASTSNHLEDIENQEQIPTQDTFGAISKYNFFSDPISIKTNQIPRIILPKCAIQRTLKLPKSIKTNE